jgi:branched-chain amino acid aminotransferase
MVNSVEPLVYLNGQFVPESQARLPISDSGVVLGATLSQLTRTFRLKPFRLADHLERLFSALERTRIDIGMSIEEIAAISHRLLAHHRQLIDDGDDLGLIHFVTPGPYATYAGRATEAEWAPTVCIHTAPLAYELWAEKMQTGARLVTPSVRHIPAECIDPTMKCRSRMHYYLADQEARREDPSATALLLDLGANITETSTANFFIVERDTIVSPKRTNILPGVSRETLIELATQLGIAFVEQDVTVADAIRADEAFLSSTPYCLMPVSQINGSAIGSTGPGPIYRRLLAAWNDLVGLDIARQIIEGANRRAGAKKRGTSRGA